MVVRRTAHAVYDTQYHLVWSPKYRKDILKGDIEVRTKKILEEIASSYEISIEEMEISSDHVHVFCSFPPRYSIAQVVKMFKSLSARALFKEYPDIKKRLWGGELWEDGYFARTVGDKVMVEMIRAYIKKHQNEDEEDPQLKLFE